MKSLASYSSSLGLIYYFNFQFPKRKLIQLYWETEVFLIISYLKILSDSKKMTQI